MAYSWYSLTFVEWVSAPWLPPPHILTSQEMASDWVGLLPSAEVQAKEFGLYSVGRWWEPL